MIKRFELATANDYAHWVGLHLQAGGKITHFYDYSMPRHDFLIAQLPFVLGGECGAEARHILVPDGIEWSVGTGMGHNTVHLASGALEGFSVPVYADVAFRSLPGYAEGMDAEVRRKTADLDRLALLKHQRPDSDLRRFACDMRNPDRAAHTASASGASVSVVGGSVRLIPPRVPLDMMPDEALALAENLRAAALGASRT